MTRKRDVESSERDLTPLKEDLHHPFMNDELLKRALTRKAYAMEKMKAKVDQEYREDQIALCALGDAVLKAIPTDRLTEKLISNGTRTYGKREDVKIRKKIKEGREKYETRKALRDIALKLKIHRYVITSVGEEKVKKQPAVLGETLEAIIGAIFVASGYERTKDAVLKWPELKKLRPI